MFVLLAVTIGTLGGASAAGLLRSGSDRPHYFPKAVELYWFDGTTDDLREGEFSDYENVVYVLGKRTVGRGRQGAQKLVDLMSELPQGTTVVVYPRLNKIQQQDGSLPQLNYPYSLYEDLCEKVQMLQRQGQIVVDEDRIRDYRSFSIER